MKKQSPLRTIFNIVLIVLVVISVVATGFLSIKGYQSNRMPEMCSNKQIIKTVKEENPNFKFSKDDKWKISKKLSDDHESFVADVDITSSKKLCSSHYKVNVKYNLVKGTWEPEKATNKIALKNHKWLFEDTDWAVTTPEGTRYELEFSDDFKVELNIFTNHNDVDDHDDDMDEHHDEDEKKKSTYTCTLSKSKDGKYYQGNIKLGKGKSALLTVTEDSVKMQLTNEGKELIFKED